MWCYVLLASRWIWRDGRGREGSGFHISTRLRLFYSSYVVEALLVKMNAC